jgi:SnoaL-like domain
VQSKPFSIFLIALTKRDADKLAELMTDHVFIDSLGNTMPGRGKIRVGWRGYYSFCPDYWVTREGILGNGNIVAVFGAAGGAVAANGKLRPGNKWRTSGALILGDSPAIDHGMPVVKPRITNSDGCRIPASD